MDMQYADNASNNDHDDFSDVMGVYNTRSAFSSSRLHLNLYDMCSTGDKPYYDDVDLISECSTPGTYVPGKYLQLSDFTPDPTNDALLWPVSLGGTMRNDPEASHVIPGHSRLADEESFSQGQVSRRSHRLSFQNPKFYVPLVVCVIIALFALGGLAAVI
ncbi:unnamed protein product [Lymnaea stagnalis]|uniref:Uncharacterized protein n=1 Tax=Lymnaea stagnalis TaxID=6523 RepID=A0AAV2HP41_LYMST